MRKISKSVIIIITGLVALTGIIWQFIPEIARYASPAPSPVLRNLRFIFGKVSIVVELVWTEEDQAKGLSGRDSLPEDRGMLFVFPKPNTPAFWMKDLKFPIDIIWIADDNKVIGFTENISPATYPTSFPPPSQIRYALEVNAGFVKSHKLKIGDVIRITEDL